MITEATQRLVSGMFVLEERGAESLKGIERPVKLYRVARTSGVRGRLEAGAAVRGMTSFVGREDELRLLMNRWERVREGQGQVVTIIGEAGIGKSAATPALPRGDWLGLAYLARMRAPRRSIRTPPFTRSRSSCAKAFIGTSDLRRWRLRWRQRRQVPASAIIPPARPIDLATPKRRA